MKERVDGEAGWAIQQWYRRSATQQWYRRSATQQEQAFLDFQRFNRRR